MRPALTALLLLLALPLSAPAQAPDKSNAAKDLHDLFDAEWERYLGASPVSATYIGDHRYDDRWPDLAAAGLKASYQGDTSVIAAPKIIMQRVPPQLDKPIVTDPAKSPFYEAFLKMPDSIPAAENVRRWMAAQP